MNITNKQIGAHLGHGQGNRRVSDDSVQYYGSTPKRKPGRPKGSGLTHYPDVLRARVPAGWLTKLRERAARDGVGLSELVRRAIQPLLYAGTAGHIANLAIEALADSKSCEPADAIEVMADLIEDTDTLDALEIFATAARNR